MRVKYSIGEKVQSFVGDTYWVEAVIIYSNHIRYNLYDGKDNTISLDEWQVLPLGEKRKAGFSVNA